MHIRHRLLTSIGMGIACAVLLAASVPGLSGEDYSKSFPVAGRADVRVESNDGSVDVITADVKQVEFRVEYKGYELGKDLRIESRQDGDRVELIARVSDHWGFSGLFRSRRLHIEVRMPRQADLRVETGDGSVKTGALEGKIDIHTGDGSIGVDGLKGDIRLRTGDGSIEARDLDGKVEARSGDGHITMDGRFDGLQVKTSDGHVEARIRPGSKMAAPWSLETGDGGIGLRVPDGFQADLDASSGDGRITLDIPLTVAGRVSRSKVHGQLNGGGPALVLHSGDGSIRIERF
jgi:DUF4097 and DUF4098 domain-containing protein YvlB